MLGFPFSPSCERTSTTSMLDMFEGNDTRLFISATATGGSLLGRTTARVVKGICDVLLLPCHFSINLKNAEKDLARGHRCARGRLWMGDICDIPDRQDVYLAFGNKVEFGLQGHLLYVGLAPTMPSTGRWNQMLATKHCFRNT
jgi:hypothetical protein